jgi:hypothetical protein
MSTPAPFRTEHPDQTTSVPYVPCSWMWSEWSPWSSSCSSSVRTRFQQCSGSGACSTNEIAYCGPQPSENFEVESLALAPCSERDANDLGTTTAATTTSATTTPKVLQTQEPYTPLPASTVQPGPGSSTWSWSGWSVWARDCGRTYRFRNSLVS